MTAPSLTAIGVALPVLFDFHKAENMLPVTGLCFGPVAGWLYCRIAVRGGEERG